MDTSMPRYFFDLHDNFTETDDLGTELLDDPAARIAAVQFAGEVLKNEPEILEVGTLQIDARDTEGNILFTVDIRLKDRR
ncbi:hypothetical protein LCM19_05805 [Qipengyuania flava]|uniref:DUF6894 family protein n=1 Tax=Qipengyuania TaxID=1855416 RepID=UPI001C873D6B|nr:hypothetical protein [Qipengyuania aestuarii]MBX7535836.1 hypothetical protein [Qipengyuania aestuarii]MCA0977871.1 hypothetical protein [Qipengyuania flava]